MVGSVPTAGRKGAHLFLKGGHGTPYYGPEAPGVY